MNKFILLLTTIFLISCSAKIQNNKTDALSNMKLPETDTSKVISDPTNTLIGKTEVLELEYIPFGCACANWITVEDRKKYKNAGFVEHCIFIEPANKELELPLYFDPYRYIVRITGQFYKKLDYPKGTKETEEKIEKAKVFRYDKIELIENPEFKSDNKVEELTLYYGAVSCSCAQWIDENLKNEPDESEHLYLEPANNKLINADTLFKGNNLPIRIRVKGQIILENGYPKGFNPTKENPEAGKVFRYTKITVLENGKK